MTLNHDSLSPLVSVIIRSTDRPSLQNTLRSVSNQTYPHIELILVNAKGPAHQSISDFLISKTHRWVNPGKPLSRSMAANMGLNAASGQYLIFLDDDDWWSPCHIQNLVDALPAADGIQKSTLSTTCQGNFDTPLWVTHSSTQLVSVKSPSSDLTYINQDSSRDPPLEDLNFQIQSIQGGELNSIRLLAGNSLAIHSVLFPRSLVIEKGCKFDENLDLFEDWDFWLQISQLAHFKFIPKATAFYLIHESSGVHALNAFYNPSSLSIYRKWLPLLNNSDLAELMRLVWSHADIVSEKQALQKDLADMVLENKALQEGLANMALENTAIQKNLENLKNEIQLLKENQNRLENEKSILQEILHEMTHSRSWRMTSGLRRLGHLLKGKNKSSNDITTVKSPSQRMYLPWLPEKLKSSLRPYLYSYFMVKSWLNKTINSKGFGHDHRLEPVTIFRSLSEDLKNTVNRHHFVLLCTYAPNGILSPNAQHYLKALANQDLKVVLCIATEKGHAVSDIGLEKASALVIRQNAGFDFALWAATFNAMPFLFGAKSVICTNDSVIGPWGNFDRFIQRIKDSSKAFVALTDSYQIKYHTQSYFFVLHRQALQHPSVQAFWSSVLSLNRKDDVILHYELGVLPLIKAANLSVEVIFPLDEIVTSIDNRNALTDQARINPTHHLWLQLIERGFPFIKAQLLFENPYHLDISNWGKVLQTQDTSNNLVDLAISHIDYLKLTRKTKAEP
jgi:glycosyltransferase involved in cell wall biosynthesis